MLDLILAYRPFIDPLNLQRWWFLLLVPLAFGVSITYKAIRVEDLSTFWRKVFGMTFQLILGIIAFGVFLFALVQYVLPRTLPMP